MLHKIASSLQYDWSSYWNARCDPRILDQWLMNGGPWKLALISLAYCLSIVWGMKWMRTRQAFQVSLAKDDELN